MLRFALGERRKRLATVERVLDALLAAGADRRTLVIGVGGGVASDLFGFAAATYMRGVPYAHVATSLVAMVDAAIGGKTGVESCRAERIWPAFSRSRRRLLRRRRAPNAAVRRRCAKGLPEIVKAAIIEGDDSSTRSKTLSPHPLRALAVERDLIAAAVKVKTAIVADDRLEAGMRELLNLGHTFAHGIERASAYRMTPRRGGRAGLARCGVAGVADRAF